jgi:hypothetical protein
LFRQAGEVRALASGLWNADIPLPLGKPAAEESEVCARPGLVLHTNDALERMAS